MPKKIRIINLELGIDPEQEIVHTTMSKNTSAKVDKEIKKLKREKELIEMVKKDRLPEEKIEEAYRAILWKTEKDGLTREELLEILGAQKLIGILTKIRKLAKTKGFELISKRVGKTAFYLLKPNTK
jgi:hypothetical protein